MTFSLAAFPLEGDPYRYHLRDMFNDPRDGGERTHFGIDIHAPRGTLVRSPVAGRVLDSPSLTEEHGRTGYGVTVRTREGYRLHFAHFDGPALVAAGASVQSGTPLGRVGNSGNARNGPTHLHFHVLDANGERVNPYPLLIQQRGDMDHLTDEEFARLQRLTASHARGWKLPESWWAGNEMRKAIARQARETYQRELPKLLSKARSERAAHDFTASDATMAQAVEYSHRMQAIAVRLERGETITAEAMRALLNAASDLANAAGTEMRHAAGEAARAVVGPLVLFAALGVAWWASGR